MLHTILRLLRLRRRPAASLVPLAEPRAALRRLLGLLVLLIILHTAAMMAFEHLPLADALWLTMTTVTTVGYGDYSAEKPLGRLATGLLMFCGGIWMAFQLVAVFVDYRSERRERMRYGRWRWKMRDHILVLNIPTENAAAYLKRLVCEFRASRRFRKLPVQIVSTRFEGGLPQPLQELGVVHFAGNASDLTALAAANADAATVIVVLARSDADPDSDGRTFDVIDRLREMGAQGRIIAECVDDANRPRLKRAGADIVVRPLRGYPEMIVRALAAPGAETILEDLFTSRNDECWRYDVEISGWSWGELVNCMVARDIGVPIAFRSRADRTVRVNPRPDEPVEADKLFVLVREGNARPDAQIAEILKR